MVETRKFVDAKQCFSLVYEGSYDQKIALHSYNYKESAWKLLHCLPVLF